MAVYRETDGDIVREYTLGDGEVVRAQSDKALIELVPTVAFGTALFLDNELQFTEKDEYIYHEAFVHPCLSTSRSRRRVCVIGGGDGCAVREILRWPDVGPIDLIDWDKDVTDFFTRRYAHLNNHSLLDPRVRIENRNIQELLHEDREYNCILIDLVDPDLTKEGQLDLWYDVLFLARRWIAEGGSIVINAGGITPWQSTTVNSLVDMVKKQFNWPIGLYKVFVPSFAREWCFLLLNQTESHVLNDLPPSLCYLSESTWLQANTWSRDYLNLQHPE